MPVSFRARWGGVRRKNGLPIPAKPGMMPEQSTKNSINTHPNPFPIQAVGPAMCQSIAAACLGLTCIYPKIPEVFSLVSIQIC